MLAVCLIIKELTHKPISHWLTTLELQLKYIFGGGLGYGYMVAIHITDPPNCTLSWAYGHARGFKQNTRQLALAPARPHSRF